MFPKHILNAGQFQNLELLDLVYNKAVEFKEAIISKQDLNLMSGKILATLFFEPSTRTRLSFESAMLRLGGQVISCENAGGHSSAKKGESVADTARVVSAYSDVLVMRHTETGAALEASEFSSIPVINAGDGSGEHPTQALLDYFTIREHFGHIINLKIGLVGDLLYGRTVHSLLQLLSIFPGVEFYLISPVELKMPQKYIEVAKNQGVKIVETSNLQEVLADLDVLYVTRIQKERFEQPEMYERIADSFIVSKETVDKMKSNAIILHPLPRVNEISTEVDSDPRAKYFIQAENGVYVRMALLDLVIKDTTEKNGLSIDLVSSQEIDITIKNEEIQVPLF